MKASMLGLVVATVAFGGSSVYFRHQLDEERARAAEVDQVSQKLKARIAELELARAAFHDSRREFPEDLASAGGSSPHMPPHSSAITSQTDKSDESPGELHLRPPQWHEPSPAMKRMMVSNVRNHNRRIYADVGDALGLDKDTTIKLVDLITQQETGGFGPTVAPANWQDVRRQQEKAISDLIGTDKVASLREYQQSLPARQEFDMLSQQLASNDLPLTQEQSKKLVDVYVAERAREPMPQYAEGSDLAEYQNAVKAWQADYAQRVSDEASHILSGEQLTAYNEIQQWQKEMREQLPAVMATGAAHGVVQGVRGGVLNATYVNDVATSLNLAPADTVVATPAEEPRKQ